MMVCHYRQGGDLLTHTLVTYVPILAAQVILEPWIRKATVEYFSSVHSSPLLTKPSLSCFFLLSVECIAKFTVRVDTSGDKKDAAGFH